MYTYKTVSTIHKYVCLYFHQCYTKVCLFYVYQHCLYVYQYYSQVCILVFPSVLETRIYSYMSISTIESYICCMSVFILDKSMYVYMVISTIHKYVCLYVHQYYTQVCFLIIPYTSIYACMSLSTRHTL